MNFQLASEVPLAFGMLLANAMVVLDEAGFGGTSDRSYNCFDCLRLIRPRLFDGRLVEQIPIMWHGILPPIARTCPRSQLCGGSILDARKPRGQLHRTSRERGCLG